MSKKPAPSQASGPGARGGAKTPARAGARQPHTPLTPARVGDAIGEDADPELDVAPNLGGEEQMQDA